MNVTKLIKFVNLSSFHGNFIVIFLFVTKKLFLHRKMKKRKIAIMIKVIIT